MHSALFFSSPLSIEQNQTIDLSIKSMSDLLQLGTQYNQIIQNAPKIHTQKNYIVEMSKM